LQQKKQFGEPVVVLRHVTKEYTITGRKETVQALEDIHLAEDGDFPSIRKGEFIMLRGPSGGGKTTLLNLLGTIDKPTQGEVVLFGTKVDTNSKDTFFG